MGCKIKKKKMLFQNFIQRGLLLIELNYKALFQIPLKGLAHVKVFQTLLLFNLLLNWENYSVFFLPVKWLNINRRSYWTPQYLLSMSYD